VEFCGRKKKRGGVGREGGREGEGWGSLKFLGKSLGTANETFKP